MRMSNAWLAALERMRAFANGAGEEPRDFHLLGTQAIAEIEAKLRSWYRAQYALCVSNGTDALRAIGHAIGLRDSEFVTTPLTWGGSIGEWLRLDNSVRFAGVDPVTLTISPSSVRNMVTRRTRAILAVDVFGNPADMTALRAVADACGLWYVSDAAPSLGARRDDLPASSLADVWVVSFGIGKGVDGGDGAAILTNNRGLYERLIWETQHAVRQRVELGLSLDNEFASNSRMNPWTALWLAATFDEQMERLQERRSILRRLLALPECANVMRSAIVAGVSVEPSFQLVVAAWRAAPCLNEVLALFRAQGFTGSISPFAMRPLFEQPAFLAQYRSQARGILDEHMLGIDLSDYFVLNLDRRDESQ